MNDIAEASWMKGFVHLTVDAFGTVSLWDHAFDADTGWPEGPPTSYLALPLTDEQVALIRATAEKGGYTP